LELAKDHSNKATSINVTSDKLFISESEKRPQVEESETNELKLTSPGLKGNAKWIVHVPGSLDSEHQTPIDSNPENTTPENVDGMVRINLEAALDGNLEAGNYVQWALKSCENVPLNSDMLERMIQSYTDWAGQMKAEGTPIPPEGNYGGRNDFSAQFPTETQNREHLTKVSQACERINSIFTSDLRQELMGMAEKGHVLARYLYATWRPMPGLTPASWDLMQDWQLNALQFTYANLDEREAAGLLAFGQSYSRGLFTPSVLSLALALQKAALDCGIEASNVQSFVSEMLSDSSLRFRDGSTMHDVLVMADHLADRCR